MNTIARRLTATLCLLCLAAGTCACKGKEPIRIGFVAGITGRVADLGVAGRNGAMLAIEERNGAGGINGHPVELLVRDDEQNPETARRVVRELIDLKTEAIIGPMTSSMAMATLPLVNDSKTIMVSPTVTTTDLSGRDDNFLRVISTTTDYAAKNANYLYERLGHRRVAAIYDRGNVPYTENWLHDFRTTLEGRGGTVVTVVPFQSSGSAVYSPLVTELLRKAPDAVLIIANAIDAAMLCQQIRKRDGNVTIHMSEWASTERFTELAGGAAEGVYISQFLNRDDPSLRYRTFLAAYRERFSQEPGFAGMAGYDAARVTLDGLSSRKYGAGLKETLLARREFQGVQQTIRFDRFGDSARNTFITVVRNGQYHTLE